MLIVIACHGKTGGDLCASDGRRVKLSELQELVNGEEAPAFRNCPKLFLLSACRGDARKGDSDDDETLNVDSFTSADTIISTFDDFGMIWIPNDQLDCFQQILYISTS